MCNYNSSFLGGGKLLNKTVCWTCTRLGWSSLVCCGHGLNDKVLVFGVSSSLHLDGLKLFLQATLLHIGHECGDLILSGFDCLSSWLSSHVLTITSLSSTLPIELMLDSGVWRVWQAGHGVVFLNFGRSYALEELLVGRVLANWVRWALRFLALMSRHRLDHMSWHNFLKRGWLWSIALCATCFVSSLEANSSTTDVLCWIDALISSTNLLLTIKLLLLLLDTRRWRQSLHVIEVGAKALLLAAALSVNAFARALSGLGVVGLLRMVVEILGATFVCGRNFGNLIDDIVWWVWLWLWWYTCFFTIGTICNSFLDVLLTCDLDALATKIFGRVLLLEGASLLEWLTFGPFTCGCHGFFSFFGRAQILFSNRLLYAVVSLI